MAWEDFERNGIKGTSGDRPIDEFAFALQRITTAYEDRYSRKPLVHELLYALETVVGSSPTRYVSDPQGLKLGEIIVQRDYELDEVDKTPYEAVYTEATWPGYHLVLQRGLNGHSQAEVEVIKIPTLELRERTLVCEYNILADDINEQMARSLIVSVLLDDYCDGYYKDKADEIQFIKVKSNGQRPNGH
jgi:hypothetical protein